MGDELIVERRPVHPRDLIVLAVGIVVAALGAACFVACRQHDAAARSKERGEQRLQVVAASANDIGVVRVALGTVVPGVFLVVAVAVLLAVRLVVLAAIGDEIAEREAVMCGKKVD